VTRRLISVAVAVVSLAVLVFFLVYTHQMEEALRRDARVFGRIYANAFVGVSAEDSTEVDEALFNILEQSLRLQVPVVLTDPATGRPTSAANLPFAYDMDDPESRDRVREYVDRLDARIEPSRLSGYGLTIHFGEPLFLARFRWVPWLTVAVLLVTVGGGGWMIYTSFQGERERIWSAMARESAHQMGTPLSSLVGWLEQLRERGLDRAAEGADVDLAREMEADVDRLLKVSRRFELIGHSPELEPVRVRDVVERLEEYFSVRLPTLGSSVRFRIDVPDDAPPVRGNETLLEWALENLVKNALDALAGDEGEVRIEYVGTRGGNAVFRVSDTGPGVDPEVRKRLFEIGVTTKERGWGVGLSLTRRIISSMHGGDIELEPGDGGAAFRLELPVAEGDA
jgi:signal transduction histidine kinase